MKVMDRISGNQQPWQSLTPTLKESDLQQTKNTYIGTEGAIETDPQPREQGQMPYSSPQNMY